jgi:hypothetical protein
MGAASEFSVALRAMSDADAVPGEDLDVVLGHVDAVRSEHRNVESAKALKVGGRREPGLAAPLLHLAPRLGDVRVEDQAAR